MSHFKVRIQYVQILQNYKYFFSFEKTYYYVNALFLFSFNNKSRSLSVSPIFISRPKVENHIQNLF